MATDGYYSLDNYVKCFSDKVLEELINTATRDEDTGEEMLKWVKEKRTNLTTNYKNVQVFFKDELDCENVDEELKFNPKDKDLYSLFFFLAPIGVQDVSLT